MQDRPQVGGCHLPGEAEERGTLSEQREPDGREIFASMELLRLAVPRRVFTLSQLKYAVDRIQWLFDNRRLIGGLTFVEEPEVLDPRAGYVWDESRQDPGTDGWGHYPRSGRAQIWVFPQCADGRVVADVVRLGKGHTEGYEPNVTNAILALAVSAKGGKIASGAWTPPPPPPVPRFPF